MAERSSNAKSGRFLLRLPPAMHQALDSAAREAGLSLNEYCVRRLGAGAMAAVGGAPAAALLARATEILGESLLGVLLLGSRARGDADADSDLDVLFAVDSGTEITREVYRRWDARPSLFAGRPKVDPHFAHLPAAGSPSNLWGEAALEGVLLFERGRLVSEALVRIRRAAAAGRLVRRVTHGQPYWAAG